MNKLQKAIMKAIKEHDSGQLEDTLRRQKALTKCINKVSKDLQNEMINTNLRKFDIIVEVYWPYKKELLRQSNVVTFNAHSVPKKSKKDSN